MSLLWLVLCGVVAYFANKRGRNALIWGLLAFFISPLLTGIVLAIMKDLSIEEEIDRLDKDTENLKREMKSNQKYNEEQRKEIQDKLVSGKEGSGANNQVTTEDTSALEKGKIECEECGEYIAADTNYCINCGSKIIEAGRRECSECQAVISEEVKFCPNCGQEMTSEVEFYTACGEETISEENEELKDDGENKES